MQFKNIMVPFDGSDPSKRAYQTALQFAIDDPSVTLHVVRVVPAEDIPMWLDDSNPIMGSIQFQIYDAKQYAEIMDRLQQKAREEVEEVVAEEEHKLGDRMKVVAITRQNAANGIIDYAEENGCQLVIMGSRGIGGVRSILGSVSYNVLHNIDLPVMIIK